MATVGDVESAARLARRAQDSVSIVEWLEFRLHPWSAFIIVPVFALANAGIRIPTGEVGELMSQPVTWGVILGLVVGKTVGITGATLLAVALNIGRLPESVTKRYVLGAGALGGIGFTVSLFVTELAFGEGVHADEAKLGVLIASLVAALIGTAICLPGRVGEPAAIEEPELAGAAR
jgi:NhaA family Na+:H+ antiporter